MLTPFELICFIVGLILVVVYFMRANWKKHTTFKHVPAPNNYPGVPPEGLTWEEAKNHCFSSIVPMTLWDWLTHCPTCGVELKDYRSAWTEYESNGSTRGQYNVIGKYCPEGHYTNLDCA